MKKRWKILIGTLASLLSFVLLLWGALWIVRAIVYSDYLGHKETVCNIPDLGNGFVPQGIAAAESGIYLQSGYHADTDALCLYWVTKDDYKEIIPIDPEGKRWESHGGGITWAGDYVYVTGDKNLIIFRYADFKTARHGDRISSIGSFEVDTSASFCFSDGAYLYVGEFYRAEDYETEPTHHFTTPDGTENRALMAAYPLNPDGSAADLHPSYFLSIPHQVQGFAQKGDTIILSRSWGLSSSCLDFYSGMKSSGISLDLSGKEVPLYYLDTSTYQKTVKMPAFSEGLAIEGDRVLISFESACDKYIVGKFFFANKIVSYPIS